MPKMKILPKPNKVVKGFKLNIQTISVIVAIAIAVVGITFFWNNVGILGNLLLLAAAIGFVPWIVLTYMEMQRVRVIEDQMPAFMLDLAETQKAGLTLPDALRVAAKTDYGRLTPEIKRINDQVSWGVPLPDALEAFGERMKRSTIIGRIVRIINESYMSGGDIARTMEATAADIIAVKEAEKERQSIMAEHVAVMYAIYFIFIGIIVGLSKTLLPMLQLNVQTAAIGGILAFQDPCIVCTMPNPPITCISCVTFGVICSMFGLGAGTTCYYRALFMLMAVIQGIFSGLVAGQIGEGKVIAGLKHSLIMTGVGFGTIMVLLRLGLM
ncbi:MAG: type II secretion system F family protein [Candidatus Aenigmatarchaeota archaeon]|nr:type II secretion system F family protein [Candidatus Aenigmarchaeota archaeon]